MGTKKPSLYPAVLHLIIDAFDGKKVETTYNIPNNAYYKKVMATVKVKYGLGNKIYKIYLISQSRANLVIDKIGEQINKAEFNANFREVKKN